MSTIRVTYHLSPAGQKAALAAGLNAASVQTLWVEPTPEWLELPGLVIDHTGQAHIGIGCPIRYPAPTGSAPYAQPRPERPTLRTDIVDNVTYPSGAWMVSPQTVHTFDSLQTAESLLAWAQGEVRQIAAERERLQAEVDAARPALEAARAVVRQRVDAEARAIVTAALADAHRHGVLAPGVDAARDRLDKPEPLDLTTARYLAEGVQSAIRRELERREAAALAEEQRQWVSRYGSAHLRELAELGIEHGKLYLEERIAHDLPGWVRDDLIGSRHDPRVSAKDPRNPPPEAVALLREARKTLPTARLVWAEVTPAEPGDPWHGYLVEGEVPWCDEYVYYGVPDELVRQP